MFPSYPYYRINSYWDSKKHKGMEVIPHERKDETTSKNLSFILTHKILLLKKFITKPKPISKTENTALMLQRFSHDLSPTMIVSSVNHNNSN